MAIKRRLKDRDTELQMAPMIDCVFLLLIFFYGNGGYES